MSDDLKLEENNTTDGLMMVIYIVIFAFLVVLFSSAESDVDRVDAVVNSVKRELVDKNVMLHKSGRSMDNISPGNFYRDVRAFFKDSNYQNISFGGGVISATTLEKELYNFSGKFTFSGNSQLSRIAEIANRYTNGTYFVRLVVTHIYSESTSGGGYRYEYVTGWAQALKELKFNMGNFAIGFETGRVKESKVSLSFSLMKKNSNNTTTK